MALAELRGMFALGDNQAAASQWDDLESKTSPWRSLCPKGVTFSIQGVPGVIIRHGIFSKIELVKRIHNFVQRVQETQSGQFTCYFPFRDHVLISISLNIKAGNDPDITEVYVYRGTEEIQEGEGGIYDVSLPKRRLHEKMKDSSGAEGAYSAIPRCTFQVASLSQLIPAILRERVNQASL